MVSSSATTPKEYLDSLAPDRRDLISQLRNLILKNLPEGYVETMNWGMLCYEIPLSTYPKTYKGEPLSYVALAAQKHYNSLYLMGFYHSPQDYQELLEGFEALGSKPDLGKSCIRFKRLDQLPLDVIAKLIRNTSVQEYIDAYEAVQNQRKK
mgnify:CR=1 FL=1